jgi:tripartite-type tricarboxylate transporter receptor subunit TctC
MTMRRRTFLALGAAAVAFLPARAQDKYPSRPVRLIVPSTAAGVHDVIARLWADRVKSSFGAVVIDNRGGGGGIIAANDVAHASPDGYALLLGSTTTQVLAPTGMANPPYDPMKSFSAATVFAFSSTAIVIHPAVPATTLNELIEYAKANPGKLSYGSAGNGSSTNMAGELFKRLAGGLDIVHVPYKGTAQGLADLIAGQIPMVSVNLTAQYLELQRAGKIRILSVNSQARLKGAADLPTSIESGLPNMVAQTSFGILGPAGMPRPIIERINQVTQQAMGDASFQSELVRVGFEPIMGIGGEQAAAVFQDELVRWTPIIKAGAGKS